jgi:GYF domain 2
MQIHVARNGQQLGQYSVEEVNGKLADGTFSPADLGWHEGAAGWAPLSSIAGVTMPTGPAIPIPPPPAPSSAPTAYPARPAQSSVGGIAPQPVQSYKGMAIASWILLGLTALLSIVPVLGFAAWFLAFIVIPVAFVLAIVILTRGGKTQGILILVTSVVVLPVFILVASLTSTIILGASVSAREKKQEKQIVENLHTLSEAKAKWVAQTKVPDGTKVTVAGLTLYLNGKEIKSIVGETYDPRPVGEKPKATLPPTKSLASHKKGAVLTASGSSLATDRSSSSVDFETEDDETPSPTASPQEL